MALLPLVTFAVPSDWRTIVPVSVIVHPDTLVSKVPLVTNSDPVGCVLTPGTARTIEPVSSFLVAKAPPFAVIVAGVTVDAVAEVDELQHKSFVLVIAVSGSVGGVKFDV